MPFKHNAARRHHSPRARYRVTNWPAYKVGLRRRGHLTIWANEAALAGSQAPRRSTPGGQPRYSDLAVELVLMLRLVFHLALRQAEGFARSLLQLLGVALPVPDHTTLSRRGRAFAGRQARVQADIGPVHLVLDSKGLELFGQGEWCAAKHGRLRRRWLELHLSVDASTGDQAAAARQPGSPSEVITPSRADAVLSTADPDQQSPRDRHIRLMAERGRIDWQRAIECGKRNHATTTMGRCKHLIGARLRARSRPAQLGEVALAVQVLNRMTRTGKPVSVRR